MKKIVYNLDTPDWVNFIVMFFYLNPCFPFGKMFADVTRVTNASFDVASMKWSK